jgi:hypothetical protein
MLFVGQWGKGSLVHRKNAIQRQVRHGTVLAKLTKAMTSQMESRMSNHTVVVSDFHEFCITQGEFARVNKEAKWDLPMASLMKGEVREVSVIPSFPPTPIIFGFWAVSIVNHIMSRYGALARSPWDDD